MTERAAVLFAVAVVCGCGTHGDAASSARPSGSSAIAGASSAATSASSGGQAPPAQSAGGEDIKPVYPNEGLAPLPAAERLCQAVHVLPAKRLEACCKTPPVAATLIASECARTLSYPLRHSAVSLSDADIDACEKAMTEETTGCDWIVGMNAPVPPACDHVVKGRLAEHAQCRSSLECPDGYQCDGLSAINIGTCEKPKEGRVLCNSAIDTLVAVARQDGAPRIHPECAGYCNVSRCEATLAEGAPCKSDVMCGAGRCAEGKCTSTPAPAPSASAKAQSSARQDPCSRLH